MHDNAAHERAVRTYYAYGDLPTQAVGVCRGLSCELNGARSLAASVGQHHSVVPVYCLGLCDRSPALAMPGGQVLSGADALQWPALPEAELVKAAVDIRAVSRRAVVTERIGKGCHSSIDRARQAGVYSALAASLGRKPAEILGMITASGEQGRGGAGYPTGDKWRACASAQGGRRYVVANGDEGDAGSYIDRVLLEDDPHAVLEGMLLCALAVGAGEGVVFIRAEYPDARSRMTQAIVEAREAGLLGSSILGSGFRFDVRVVSGRGSYVCGEETALLNAIEGRRGEVRVRPPYPATAGLSGCPTVVNNIETLVNVPWIIREGPESYRRLGTAASPGTKAFCLNRGFARPGIVEAEFGVTLSELVYSHGGGSRDARPLKAVALGGPMGTVLTPADFDVVLDYPLLRKRGIRLGHGGLVAIPEAVAMAEVLLNWTEFMAAESCGKCVPCGIGSGRALALVHRLAGTGPVPSSVTADLVRLLEVIEAGSLCGFGQGIAAPLRALARMAYPPQAGDESSGG